VVFSKESVNERLRKLEEVLGKLREREGITREAYRRDTDTQWVIERGLEIASSAILDVGNHILAGAYQVSVEHYEEVLEKLREKGVISSDLYGELRGLGGFRNILVHGYLRVNPDLVYEHYKRALESFPRFVAEIEEWLEGQG
jgi:uncharacterized protein YutE (UPF0331/DUF86 family)